VRFSIIIPVKELNDYLTESIPIMLSLDHDSFEIIILPNEKPKKLKPFFKDRRIKIIPTGKVSPAIKRDIGAKKSNADILAFIDDDAYPKADWLKLADKIFREKKYAAVCGPAITPENDTLAQNASGLAFESLIGGGGMAYRYKPAKNSFFVNDYPTVNLLVSRKAFFDVNGFDNAFWPGEDTKFCLDLIKKGHKIWYCKDLIVWHHRRGLFFPHLKQVGNYGKHRGYFAKKFPETSFHLTYFIPSIFFIGNICLLILSFFSQFFLKTWGVLLAIYFILLLIDIFSRTKDIAMGIMAILTIFLTHLTYGAMFLKGLLSRNFRSELR
jgi:GT2 family glycosyltransferase